jgi:farnesyl-diphosphate farnesyltransferase
MSPAPQPPERPTALTDLPRLIQGVARSFALSLLCLPGGMRTPVGLAYVLARASDTVADSMDEGARDPDRRTARRRALDALQGAIRASAQEPPLTSGLLGPSIADLGPVPKADEQRLLHQLDALVAGLRLLPAGDRRRIADVCDTIVAGQRLDLQRFDHGAGELHALALSAELVDYTWRVAGCVGHFWSASCEAHVPLWRTRPLDAMMADGARFGMGLQRLNLLRDTHQDLTLGRCYWPIEELDRVGLTPHALAQAVHARDAKALQAMRPLMAHWIEQARADLSHGIGYTVSVRPVRLRWACALPALLGLQTLRAIEHLGPLALTQSVKVPRTWVYRLLLRLALGGLRPSALQRLALHLGATPSGVAGLVDNGTMVA